MNSFNGDALKKYILLALCLFLLFAARVYLVTFTAPSYRHPASIEFYKTGIMDPKDYNGPSGSDVFSTVSVSQHNDGYYIWVNFSSKTSGHEVVIRSVELKSKTLNLRREFNEPAYFETEDKGYFDTYKLVFKSLDESKFPPSVKSFKISVAYELDGQAHDVKFRVKRYNVGSPIR